MAEQIYLNDDWLFAGHWKQSYQGGAVTDGEPVRLPHTVATLPFHYFDERLLHKVCTYQRRLQISGEWKGMRLLLTFEGAAHSTRVYVNGAMVGSHSCGYTPFTVDITDVAVYGKDNLLTVRLDSRTGLPQPPFGGAAEELAFGGLYRDVYLQVKDPVYMRRVFYQPTLQEIPKTRGMSLKRLQEVSMTGRIVTEIALSEKAVKRAEEHRLFVCQFLDDKQISNQPLAPDGRTMTLAGKVHLWDTASPFCYELRTEIRVDGETVDTHIARIGFRHIQWKAKGLYLNGRRLKLRGLNRHQSYPYVGIAMPEAIQKEDARILRQELGCNTVRTSDGAPSSAFLDGCDEYGVLAFVDVPQPVMEQSEDWQKAAVRAVRDTIVANRNHPSVFLWGVRYADEVDEAFGASVLMAARECDETRLLAGSYQIKPEYVPEAVFGYHDFSYQEEGGGIEPKAEVASDRNKPYLLSGFGGKLCPASAWDDEDKRREQMLTHTAALNAIMADDEIAGGYGQSFCDHAVAQAFSDGDGMCYQGVMDAFRNPKAPAYVYAAQAVRDEVLYVSSDLNRRGRAGQVFGDVYLVFNAPLVRMYANDRLLHEYAAEDTTFSDMRHGPVLLEDFVGDVVSGQAEVSRRQGKLLTSYLNDRVIYGNGVSGKTRLAVAQLSRMYQMPEKVLDALYDRLFEKTRAVRYRFCAVRDGEVVAEVVKEPVRAMHLSVQCSAKKLVELHSYDVAAVRVRALDQNDNLLTHYGELLEISIEGEAERIGPPVVPLQGGMGGFYVRSAGKEGQCTLTLRALGMEPVTLSLTVEIGIHEEEQKQPFSEEWLAENDPELKKEQEEQEEAAAE